MTRPRADRARVRVQALCSQYGWALWGFIQEAASPIDYDFHRFGMERFEKAAATFRGGGLPRLLEQMVVRRCRRRLTCRPGPGWWSSAGEWSAARSPTT